jgi:hypothetical protein
MSASASGVTDRRRVAGIAYAIVFRHLTQNPSARTQGGCAPTGHSFTRPRETNAYIGQLNAELLAFSKG